MAAERAVCRLSRPNGCVQRRITRPPTSGSARRPDEQFNAALTAILPHRRGPCLPHRPGPGLSQPRRTASAIRASLQAQQLTFDIPVDHAQLLGLRGRTPYLERQINDAYEELGAARLEEGYSPQVESGRRAALDEARRALVEARGRVAREEQGVSLAVPYSVLPGTLCLLQEVGEYETVLRVGGALLEAREARPFRRDVLLSMALAHCGLASAAFDEQAVAAGCARMEQAAGLLSEAGKPLLAPALAASMRAALGDFRPSCVLDQLQLPLAAEYAPVRKQALAHLRGLLADPPSGGSTPVDAAYARIALERLTAQETARLVDWPAAATGNAPWVTPSVLRRAATAQLAIGLLHRQPSLVRDADVVLQTLRKGEDVAAEMLAAKVLLGAPHAAERMLAEEERSGGPPPPPSQAASRGEVAAFVREKQAPGEGQLPGMVLFTEIWISQVALTSFRDTAADAPPVSLVDYFDDARVVGWLALNGTGAGDSPVAGAVARLRGWLGDARGGLAGIGGALAAGGSDSEESPRTVLRQPITDEPKSLLNPSLQNRSARSDSGRSPRSSSTGSDGPSPGGDEVWALSGARVLWAALLVAGIVAVATYAGRSLRTPPPGAQALGTGTAARSSSSALWSSHGKEAAQPITRAAAAAVIGDWQVAKAAAMGPRRNQAPLREVLAEPLLSVILRQASQAQAAGWFWAFNLKHVKIESVQPSPRGGGGGTAAVVRARLRESAVLWGENGRQADSYDSSYRVEYTLTQQQPQDGWRISEAVVLGS